MENKFIQVGIQPVYEQQPKSAKWYEDKPVISIVILTVITLACVLCDLFIPKDPAYMDLYHANVSPNHEFLFGTDTMGRDIFSMIWYGGRISLFISFFATVISTLIAILFGVLSGLSPKWLDDLLMRLIDIFLSIPNLLFIILIQAILGQANVLTISIVIGITGWINIAKVVSTEVRQIRNSEYILAARCMGAGFFHILWKHLAPNFVSSIMFMVVMNVRGAIVAESTLSFLGIGLPLEIISWGTMLSMAENAMTSGSWWMIFFPGIFLIITLVAITNMGNCLRKNVNRRESNL